MEQKHLKILLMDSNLKEARLIREMLHQSGNSWLELRHVEEVSLGLRSLKEGGIDIVLMDLGILQKPWAESFDEVLSKAQGVPIVILASMENEETALDAVSRGARDYVLKEEVDGDWLVRFLYHTIHQNFIRRQASPSIETPRQASDSADRLANFSRELNQSRDFTELLAIAKKDLPELSHAEIFSIFLMDSKRARLNLACHNHPERGTPDEHSDPESGSIMWKAVKTAEPVRVDTFSESGREKSDREKQYLDDTAVCVPLLADNQVIGTVNFSSFEKQNSPSADLPRLRCIADHLALAIQNAILRQKMKHILMMDELTHLFNRQYFYDRLAREVAQAKSSGRTVSVLLIEVDNLRKINDFFGHSAGDAVLRNSARLVQAYLGSGDVACRFSGTKFAVILPGRTDAEAFKAAETMRREILARPISMSGTQEIKTSVSIGVSGMQMNDSDDFILRRAHDALASAREKGHNLCVLAPSKMELAHSKL
jgi:diguanylate cyclase (GGDEF)-like protein